MYLSPAHCLFVNGRTRITSLYISLHVGAARPNDSLYDLFQSNGVAIGPLRLRRRAIAHFTHHRRCYHVSITDYSSGAFSLLTHTHRQNVLDGRSRATCCQFLQVPANPHTIHDSDDPICKMISRFCTVIFSNPSRGVGRISSSEHLFATAVSRSC